MRNESVVKDRIDRRVRALVARLDLDYFTIALAFDTRNEGDRVACETSCDWEYRQASLRWNLPTVALLDDDQLDAIIVHELVHVLNASVWEELPVTLRNRLAKHNELATEHVARAILAVLR